MQRSSAHELPKVHMEEAEIYNNSVKQYYAINIITRNTTFAGTREARLDFLVWFPVVCWFPVSKPANRCPTVKSNNTSIKAKQTDQR